MHSLLIIVGVNRKDNIRERRVSIVHSIVGTTRYYVGRTGSYFLLQYYIHVYSYSTVLERGTNRGRGENTEDKQDLTQASDGNPMCKV